MNVSPTVPATRLLGLGHHQPARVVTNHELAQRLDSSDEWIRTRVGIVSRSIAEPDESVVDLAVAAAGKALAHSGRQPAEIDLVVVATTTAESSMPNTAGRVAHRLGVRAPGAFDVNAGCAGFGYALALASDAVRAGSSRYALVVGAEKMSAWVDWTDRSTCILFGDGAGAAVVGPVTGTARPAGIGPVVWGSVGELADRIRIPDRHSYLTQDGNRVFWWATNELFGVIEQACQRAGVRTDELLGFVPHQANLRIIEAIARRLDLPRATVATDVVHAGNTGGASVPLALSRMVHAGTVPSGAPILLLGFGAGLCYAAQVVAAP
ncbi:beta-ketoacyl-ACP synthase III [Micromonospora yangpuensis]|uniref:Beta-ketoacyl-[acyl-carrier-protein] synthase III n=1 Tax=Micromonospora yangpuensis TaxID=683228 RepID=A0A1C6UFK9_9ACTN|nr:beta-ketoacyl-ACP synthase III [Micromonospora yangpuensis]GGM05854.1 3-oxoacyl-[acyl-carrier-protein] synthase 3 protein 4 [Micromonospora yangpuensis]SCL52673.1 3-oxoacyl-[acyl-carrier-protein] synthase III [Micromonospora yangpuensis]